MAPDGMTAGPWVLVVGMHRSGTSALTGLLAGLGLALPTAEDLMAGEPGNPVHYESRALAQLNEHLLEALGGSWSAPPPLEPGWENGPEAIAFDDEARAELHRVYDSPGAKVWKDPRLCLLLPYWLRLLAPPTPAVLIWRAPQEVAASLHRRDGWTTTVGLALWSAYNRAALAALVGRPVFVLDADSLLDEPDHVADGVAAWLESLGMTAADGGQWERGGPSPVSKELLTRGPTQPTGIAAVDELSATLKGLSGPHTALDAVTVPAVPAWMDDALAGQHLLAEVTRKYDGLRAEHQALVGVHQALATSFEEHIAHIRDLEGHLAAHVRHVEAQDHELRELRERTVGQQSELDALGAERANLERQVGDLAAHSARVEQELAALRQTLSWRVTAPLRRLRRS